MTKLLLIERVQGALALQPKTGQCWVYRFINRHPELKSQYNRKYNYQRAKYKDSEVIQAWFRLV
jgi:hypothetical protein